MKVLVITPAWPTPEHPERVPFIVRQVDALRRSGVDIHIFSFQGGFHPWNYLRAWLKLRRCLRACNYDLLHTHFGQSGLLAISPIGCPLVVTYHGSDLNGCFGPRATLSGFILQKVSQLVALKAREIIVVAEYLARFLPRNKTYHVIPCGVDLDLLRPVPRSEARKELGLSADRRYILFASGIQNNPIKRFALANEVISQLPDHYNAELLAVIGVPPVQIPFYLSAADVLLLTSVCEGSPTIVKEALACNLPVVSVDVGDVRELIGTVEGCIVCDDHRPQTLAAAVAKVLDAPAPFSGRTAVWDLDENLLARKILEVYNRALSSGRDVADS
jgi:teichuronic acid biosynthesis glycosyltransferase TuaC